MAASVQPRLRLIWMVDRSGSMIPDGNIQSVNSTMREMLPLLRRLGSEHRIDISVQVLGFDSVVEWLVDEPAPIDQFRWVDLAGTQRGLSEMGLAVATVSASLAQSQLPGAPDTPGIIAVVSDGLWTDTRTPTAADAIAALDVEESTRSCTRVAVAIGRDPATDALGCFAGEDGRVIAASNPQQLVSAWVAAIETLVKRVRS